MSLRLILQRVKMIILIQKIKIYKFHRINTQKQTNKKQ
jgi:hypothetical protein